MKRMLMVLSMSRRKKILSIGHSYVLSVNRSIIREVAQANQFDVTIVAPEHFHGSLREVNCETENSLVNMITIPVYLSKKIHFFFYHPQKIREVLQKEKWDVIHLWEEPYIFSGWQIARLAHQLSIPFFFWTAQNLKKSYPFPFSYFEKKVLSWQSGWLACGSLVKKTLIEEKSYPSHNMEIIPLAVDTNSFKEFSGEQKESVKKQLGLDGPLMGMLGRLTIDKGVDLILKVLEELKDELPWSFIFFGDGPEKKKIELWKNQNGLSQRVKIKLLKHDEVQQYLPALDLLVAPSQTMPHWQEQFGRMLVEAFASGVPVIGSDSGEIPYVIKDSGLVVGEKDVEGWKKSIRDVLLKSSLAENLKEKGLLRAQDFSAKKIGQDYISYYSKTFKLPP